MKRKDLIGMSLAALAAPAAASAAPTTTDLDEVIRSRNSGSLVLPGGGARGAYAAGVIEGIRSRAGVADGQPLPGVDVVVGTSIGAINGWFVATAQYSRLRSLWQTISDQHIFAIKSKYRAVVTPGSGLLTRVFEAALISQGLTSNLTGLLDGSRVQAWLDRNIDPSIPVIVPFIFSATNLGLQRSDLFYQLPSEIGTSTRDDGSRRIRSLFGQQIIAREIDAGRLSAALAGSSAIPIIFDPVKIAFDEGVQTYIDGGIADSAPLDLARAGSRRVQLILVDPAQAPVKAYPNAAAVGIAAFSIAQSRILDGSLRAAYLETAGKRLFGRAALSPQQQAFFQNIFDVELSLIRPQSELAVSVAGFDDARGIANAYDLGRRTGEGGFVPYDPGTQFR
jgi:predicted acylesterase/phospholipase RssA